MGDPAPSLGLVQLREALIAFLDRTMPACADIDYRLVGTGAALLHGVSLPVGDIDILVREREAVDAFGAALSPFKCLESPAWLAEAHQYYGNYEVHGVEVGISTVEVESDIDTVETFGRGPWEHYVLLPCDRYAVPTVALELRLITELWRNRPERYHPIIAHLRTYGCDYEFISRGFRAAGLNQIIQETVLRKLEGAPFRAVACHGHT